MNKADCQPVTVCISFASKILITRPALTIAYIRSARVPWRKARRFIKRKKTGTRINT